MLAGLPVALLPMSSQATTVTSAFNVTLTLANACTFGAAAADLAFTPPASGILDSAVGASTALNVTCTQNYAASIQLNAGTHVSGSQRRMADGSGHFVSYNLFTDSPGGTAWGIGATAPRAYTGTGSADTVSVFGQVPVQSTPPAGAYTDVVTASITF
jgi:spore coat protein U-like protein